MTAPTLSLTERQALIAVRAFILGAIGSDGKAIEVVKGQDNRVPAPRTPDYVVMTTMNRRLLATPSTTYHDGALDDTPGAGLREDLAPAELDIQLDFHGPRSLDLCTVVHSLTRTSYSTEAFAASGFDVTPLYTNEPHQSGFSNGEQQIENTWILDLTVQCNPILTSGQDFADELVVGLLEVDATYPPT